LNFSYTKLGIVRTDGQRVGQILTNLLSNAIRNTDTGTVQVDASMSERGRRSVLTLRVSDTGCGIAPEVEERLFQPFMRAHNSRRGTGLGLAIVKGLVDQLDGEIAYATGPQGTTFTIKLPMRQLGQVPVRDPNVAHDQANMSNHSAFDEAQVVHAPHPDIARAKLLLLDDDVSIQETVGDFLTDKGFEVHVVGTVAYAMQSIADERYDCLLLDMELPDGSGNDVANFARTTKNHHTPTVAFSAYHDLLATRDAGVFSATLKKPVAVEELVASLEAQISAGQPAPSLS
jgi:CheY-like chemotaxis protein/anti-sigma regulatory factor (Ser/Thr protein kinase)